MQSTNIHIKGDLSFSDLMKQVKNDPEFYKTGAIGIFIGVVRGETPRGETVKKLELEAYEEKADEALKKICKELREKAGIFDVQIHHLIGEFNVSEDLVYVVVIGAHRHDIFPTLQEAVERYKKEAPIFKKEHILKNGAPSSYWVNELKKV